MTQNLHAEAYEMQRELAQIDAQIKELRAEQKKVEEAYTKAINEIKASGITSANGLKLVEKIKRSTSRMIMLDKIKAENPDILFQTGTYAMKAAEMEWGDIKKQAYLDHYDYENNYKILLGELDTACGGKKYNDFTVDEVTESVTYAIEPEEIMEV
jgi:hypothetical protein